MARPTRATCTPPCGQCSHRWRLHSALARCPCRQEPCPRASAGSQPALLWASAARGEECCPNMHAFSAMCMDSLSTHPLRGDRLAGKRSWTLGPGSACPARPCRARASSWWQTARCCRSTARVRALQTATQAVNYARKRFAKGGVGTGLYRCPLAPLMMGWQSPWSMQGRAAHTDREPSCVCAGG